MGFPENTCEIMILMVVRNIIDNCRKTQYDKMVKFTL
jgi:hypothetical protein